MHNRVGMFLATHGQTRFGACIFFISDKLFSSLTKLFSLFFCNKEKILILLSLMASTILALKGHMQKDFLHYRKDFSSGQV